MSHPLALIRTARPSPLVSAGWLASPDPQEWLREVAHCRRQGRPVAMFPVATSPADPRPAGVFLLPRGAVPAFRPRVQSLAEIAPGVHAPADAILSAGLPENERGYFFPHGIHFFHPTLGLTGFEVRDEVTPEKLLEAPPQGRTLWNFAVHADRFAPKLEGLVVAMPPDPGGMLEEAGSEIGDRRDQAKPGGSWHGKAGTVGKGLAGGAVLGVGWIFSALGKAADFISGSQGPVARRTTPNPLDRMREWAQKHWQHLSDQRSREIDRLMKLMEKDPDVGLRYALPLTGTGQSRGVAPPTWKLGLNNPRYTLGNGGGAIDGWDIGNEARLKLERQYREAAAREIALGRHGRAAYIFGNLLGDWTSAARSLVAAGRHRDAVAIYLHKLHNQAAAAKCLEDAGLLLQAAAIHAEAGAFEKAGDLHARLGNHAQARELWLSELDRQRDPLQKARLLSQKLDDRPGAIALLESTWQGNSRVAPALEALFIILRENGESARAVDLLRRMMRSDFNSLSLSDRLQLAHAEAGRWTSPDLFHALETEAYPRIAEALTSGTGDTRPLLEFLPKLDPSDILLQRDATRFSLLKSPPPLPKSGAYSGLLRPKQIIPAPHGIRWDSISTLPKGISLAGYGKDMLSVGHLRENGCHSSALRTTDDPGDGEVRHLVTTSPRSNGRLFHFREHGRLHYRALDRMRTPADDAIGTLRGILAAGPFGTDGDFALLQYTATSSLSVHIYSQAAELRRTLPVDFAPPSATELDWKIAGRGGHLCFAADGFVAWLFPGGGFSTMSLGDDPSSLHLSPRYGLKEALVSAGGEVLVIEFSAPDKPPETVNLFSNPAGSRSPASCYLPDGSIVVAHRGGGAVFTPGVRLKPAATLSFPGDAGDPVAICPRGTGGFGILTDSGQLILFIR